MRPAPQLAEVIADRAIAAHVARYPRPVPLPAVECPECLGTGGGEAIVGGWTVPRNKRVDCPKCKGAGELHVVCVCGKPATTKIAWDITELCDDCAKCTDCLDGLDLAVAFALRVLP